MERVIRLFFEKEKQMRKDWASKVNFTEELVIRILNDTWHMYYEKGYGRSRNFFNPLIPNFVERAQFIF